MNVAFLLQVARDFLLQAARDSCSKLLGTVSDMQGHSGIFLYNNREIVVDLTVGVWENTDS